MTTIISADTVLEVTERPEGADLWLTPAQFESVTGFALKPDGFCRGALCIPVPPARAARLRRGRSSSSAINIAEFAALTERPWVGSDAGDCWVLEEPAAARNDALQSLAAPDFELPDLRGVPHRLSDYRGLKVLLASWASW